MYDYYSLISSFIYTQRLVATILQSGDRHFLQTFHEGQVGGLCRFIVSFLFVNDDKRLRVCSTRPLCAIGIMAVYFLYIIHNVCGAFGIRQAHYTVFALLKILMWSPPYPKNAFETVFSTLSESAPYSRSSRCLVLQDAEYFPHVRPSAIFLSKWSIPNIANKIRHIQQAGKIGANKKGDRTNATIDFIRPLSLPS